MFKMNPRDLPDWAWLVVLFTPPALLTSLLWFIVSETMKVTAMVQFVAKAGEAGLLERPGVRELAVAAFSDAAPFQVLIVIISAVVMLNMAIVISARRSARPSYS
jgi:hypothetical protein